MQTFGFALLLDCLTNILKDGDMRRHGDQVNLTVMS